MAHFDQSPRRGLRGYVSFSHADRRLVERLKAHLRAVEAEYQIEFWHDTEIRAGDSWYAKIDRAIASADVFILCVSPHYIASEYRYKVEWPAILERARTGAALIFPVILSPCMWFGFVGPFQAIPMDGTKVRPITQWRLQDSGHAAAAMQIKHSIQAHALRRSPVTTDDGGIASLTIPYAPANAEKLSLDDIDQAVAAVIGRRTKSTVD